jgi:hypothetical protein
MPTSATATRVLEETKRFRDALPDLLRSCPGKWVVFRDGEVHSIHDTEDSAFRAGVEAFGLRGGQVIAQVKPQKPIPLTAGILFGRH